MASQVAAFGSGMNLARYTFYQKVGPRIKSVLSGDDENSLGALFMPYIPKAKEVSR